MPTRLAALLAVLATVAAALLSGCGSSSGDGAGSDTATRSESAPPAGAPAGASARSCDAYASDAESLRATGIPCDRARQVMVGWQRQASCALPSGASRGGCLVRSYHCQAARTDRGTAVSCARAGESIAFLLRRN